MILLTILMVVLQYFSELFYPFSDTVGYFESKIFKTSAKNITFSFTLLNLLMGLQYRHTCNTLETS